MEHLEPECPSTPLRALATECARLDEAVARRLGLHAVELHAVTALAGAGGLTPGQLGAALGLSSGAVTALADRLERHALVKRIPHPTDRRSTLLCLTAEAEGIGRDAFGALGGELGGLLERFAPAERRAILAFLEHAAAATRRHAETQAALSPAAGRARRAS